MNHARLLQLVTLMLYAGPLIAGLAGFGWGVVPAFAVILVAWQIVMRPAEWPRDPVAWRETTVQVGAALQVAVAVVIVGCGWCVIESAHWCDSPSFCSTFAATPSSA